MLKFTGYSQIDLNVNGHTHQVILKADETLLHVLRDKLGLTGPKAGCENGDCGACTVLIDSKPMKACMVVALTCIGKSIVTIEGLDNTEIQRAFVNKGGFQCGYCTSGFILNAYAMLEDNPNISEADQKVWLDANLCRCTGYEGIKEAVKAAKEMIKDQH